MRESFLVPEKPISYLGEEGASSKLFNSQAATQGAALFSGEPVRLSLRAQQNFDRGCLLAEQGESESALLAFQAALQSVLRSEQPEDVSLRRNAAHQLLRLMRNTQ